MLSSGANVVDSCLSNKPAAKNVYMCYFKLKLFMQKCESNQSTNVSLAYSLVSFYFWFMTGKSS